MVVVGSRVLAPVAFAGPMRRAGRVPVTPAPPSDRHRPPA